AERIGNRPYFEIEIDRQQIARYGVRLGDVQDIITAAVGGANITTTIEGRERYPVRVRYMRELRDNAEAIKRIFVPTSSGAQVPLSQLARFEKKPGPAMISSENAMTYARIFINVDPGVIGIVDFVGLAKKTLAQKIKSGELVLPSGYYISWSGQYESEMEARKTLAIALPLCLVFIFFLIYLQFKDVVSLTLSLVGLPISIAGGAILLYLFHFNFSTAVWVGFIAVFGVATDNAVILIAFLNDLFKEKKISSIDEIKETVSEGGLVRVRALTMTTLTTIIGLLPVMFFTSAGSEIMKPMATPTIGGLTLATFANLILVPVLYCWIKERKFKNLNKFSSPNAE
ncbi:CusA/CzcA family heavy metal efflux RND transporter, partial [Candidatus Desantisbacteria bacterium CG_4_9_14_3_um_filter_50_7]